MGDPPADLDLLALLRATPTIIYALDVRTRQILFQNHRLDAFLGYPASDPPLDVAGDWRHYMHVDDQALFAKQFERMRALVVGDIVSWEYRLRRPDGSWRHFLNRDTLLPGSGDRRIVVGVASDITEKKEAELQMALVLGEMRHRSKNFAAVISAIAHQTRPKTAARAVEAFDSLVSRLHTLMAAGEMVLASNDREASMATIIETALAPLLGSPPVNVVILPGDTVLLGEQQAGGLALALHELATNALKYGALSNSSGRVTLGWTQLGDRVVQVSWAESGGPYVSMPAEEGFGSRVLQSAIPGSRVECIFAPEGFRWSAVFAPSTG